MNHLWRTIAVGALVAAHGTSGFGQTAEQPVVLTIEINNVVFYRGDVTDPAKMARDPGVTTPGPSRAFQYSAAVSDIVAVNGKPVKGLLTSRTSALIARVNPQAGQAIADHDGNGPYLSFFQFQDPTGTWIGTLWTGGGLPGPSHAILAGNGAFFGVEGEHREWEQVTPFRNASVSEDPANRRLNGGGKGRVILSLYPKYRPAVEILPAGPAIYHSADLSPVTATSPARAGEILTVRAKNLGPTRPDLLPPGSRLFKADAVEVVNSPIEVTVNGMDTEVINKIGWPGTYDLYRVDFRVPSGLPQGKVTIHLTSAWIPGPPVEFEVQ